MKKIRLYLGILAWLLASTCCSNDPFEEDNREEFPMENQEGQSGADASGNLLDFDIVLDADDEQYTEPEEVIVTDPDDDSYDDFVENSTFTATVTIAYAGATATVTNNVEGVSVTQEGAHVVIRSEVKKVEYLLTGATTDGSLKIYSSNKFKLTLDGVDIASSKSAALNIQSSKRCFVVLKEGTENRLQDAAAYQTADGEDEKACLFSEGQLIFSGSGSLEITANYKHGIASDDYLRFRQGTQITVNRAVKDALHTNDAILIGGGTLTLTADGDGMECEAGAIDIAAGKITVNCGDDAIAATYEGTDNSVVPAVQIRGGRIRVNSTGEKGKGVKSAGSVSVSGGILQAQVSGAAAKGVSCDGDMTVTAGKLTVLTTGAPLYEDNDLSSAAGIKCDGNLTVSGGEIAVKSSGAAGKGINCDGMIHISDGTVRIITTGKQYVYGQLDSSAKGIKSDGNLTISGGSVWVRTTGGEGSEGIESKSTLTINNGEVAVYAYDDCLNASKHLAINGGTVYCYSSGNDGIDSNGTLTITGGTTIAAGTMSPEEGIDCDQNTFTITGGTLLGIGGASSSPTSSACTQRSVIYGGSGSSGQYLCIQSADGKNILLYQIPRTYTQMTVLFSSPELADADYTIYTGGSATGGSSFYGLYTGSSYTPGTQAATFTASSTVNHVGNTSGTPGGGRPGFGW